MREDLKSKGRQNLVLGSPHFTSASVPVDNAAVRWDGLTLVGLKKLEYIYIYMLSKCSQIFRCSTKDVNLAWEMNLKQNEAQSVCAESAHKGVN